MTAPPTAPSSAKHALIARALEHELGQGKYPVGSTLPSEPTLTHQFGVSRHTVRAALRTLQERGLIASHKGLGSVVLATAASQQYTQGFGSAEDLLQYVASTRVAHRSKSEIVVDDALASWLGCRAGERWWKLKVLRCALSAPGHDGDHDGDGPTADTADTATTGQLPASLADVYLPYAFGALLVEELDHGRPIFRFIEEQLGEPISEIRQEINAVMPTADEAATLQLAPAEPALAIVRRYFGRHGQVLEVTRTLHRGPSFTYAMNLKLTSPRERG